MSNKPSLAIALEETGGKAPTRVEKQEAAAPTKAATSKTRRGVPITVLYPQEVRDQLKILSVQNKTTMHNLVAEALNLLFSKYNKPEIAPYER
jgi:hypothetical protein